MNKFMFLFLSEDKAAIGEGLNSKNTISEAKLEKNEFVLESCNREGWSY